MPISTRQEKLRLFHHGQEQNSKRLDKSFGILYLVYQISPKIVFVPIREDQRNG